MNRLLFDDISTSIENLYNNLFLVALDRNYNLRAIVQDVSEHIDVYYENTDVVVPRGSDNPIKNSEEGQKLLDSGYPDGWQVYNVTSEGKIVKFQPDHTPENGYHAYEVSTPRDIPSSILRKMLEDGVISKSDYNKYRKGKKEIYEKKYKN